MKLPSVSHVPKTVERVLCGDGSIGEKGGKITAENINLAHLPTVAPRSPRTCFRNFEGEILQFFSNGERVCVITQFQGVYRAWVWDRQHEWWLALDLQNPRDGVFLYAHAWRGVRLYLPAFSALIDTETVSVFYTDKPLVSSVSLPPYDENLASNNQHMLYFESRDVSYYAVDEYVLVQYDYMGFDQKKTLFLRLAMVDADLGSIILEGEGAPDLLNARPGSVTLCYDIPSLMGIFADHERLYGFERNRIYISAKEGRGICFTPLAEHDAEHTAVMIELEAEITGGCMYKGSPIFFTDGAAVRLVEDRELGFRVSVTPTVGVTPQAVTSPAVVGDKICYFSRYGLTLFDGKEGRVVRADLPTPQGGAAVADGRFYTFYAADENEGALYAYDIASDLLYSLGSAEQIRVMFALGGVLIGAAFDEDLEPLLVVFAHWESLPYPISAIAERGGLSDVIEKEFESVLHLEEDRSPDGDFSPFLLLMDAALGEGAELALSLYCDGEEAPAEHFVLTGPQKRKTHALACFPRRCRSYRVSLNGKGDFRVFDIRSRRRV